MSNLATIKTRLDTELRDSANKTFTTSEKLEIITRAVDDEGVYSVLEEQIAVVNMQRTYAVAANTKGVYDVQIDANGDGFPETDMPRDGWDFINGNLIIKPKYMNLQTGYTLFVTEARKWTVNDSWPDYLDSYILNGSIIQAVDILENGFTTRFLKNDVTMGDLISRANSAKQERQRQRQSLRNQRAVRG